MHRESVTKWARRYVLASATFLVAWYALLAVGASRRASVALGLYGFVFHVVFGKAYTLVPAYFDRQLAVPWAPAVQFPLAVAGVVGLAAAPQPAVPGVVGAAGAALWAAGVAVFVGALAWSVRGNPTGRETATSDVNASRRPVDRAANAFVPVVLGYLVAGAYATLAGRAPLPALVDGYPPRATHLLAAGGATLLVFAVGFRLLPRFMAATPPRWLVRVVLPAGAVAPALLAWSLGAGAWFRAGAVLQATAVTGFAGAVGATYGRSDRRRVGFAGVLAGAAAGVAAVALGLFFAVHGATPALVDAHHRLALGGFLGLTVVGVAYQFYPPAAGTFPWANDRAALASIAALAAGLAAQVAGLAAARPAVETGGALCSLAGALLYLSLVAGLFRER